MKKLFFCILLLYGCKNCYSQNDSLLKLYNNQTIYRFGDKYVKGNETLSFQNLKYEFKSPVTSKLYMLSKKNLVTSKILSFTSFAAILLSGAYINKNRDVSFGLLCGSIVLNIANFHLRKLSQQYLDRALWQRNKEILFGNDKF